MHNSYLLPTNIYTVDCLSYFTRNTQTSGRPVSGALETFQIGVSHSLEPITGMYPSSYPGLDARPFRIVGKSVVSGLFISSEIIRINAKFVQLPFVMPTISVRHLRWETRLLSTDCDRMPFTMSFLSRIGLLSQSTCFLLSFPYS